MILYGMAGCPYCEAARKFLEVQKIPVEIRTSDPVIDGGVRLLRAVQFEEKEDGFLMIVPKEAAWPVLVAPEVQRVIQGWNPQQYDELVDAYQRGLRGRARDAAVAEINAAGKTEKPSEAGEPVQEAAGVSAVPGVVGERGDVPAGDLAAAHR